MKELPDHKSSDEHDNLPKAGLILHVYYSDIGLEILTQVVPAEEYFEKIIITHSLTPDSLKNFKDEVPLELANKCIFIKVENHLRDSGPFIQALRSNYLKDYKAVLKLHTKKSPHLQNNRGALWRINLIDSLLDPRYIKSVIRELASNNDALWICPKNWISTKKQWGFNSFQLWKIMGDLGKAFKGPCPFPAGNMYWLNSHLSQEIKHIEIPTLACNKNLNISWNDGSFEHVIERVPSQFSSLVF